MHPPIMYSFWRNYKEGTVFTEAPLFYHSLSREAADLIMQLSLECLSVVHEIGKRCPEVDASHAIIVDEWYLKSYANDIDDATNLYSSVRSNKAYTGLRHPMTCVEPASASIPAQLVPNFGFRYLSEDIPYGLLVAKGIAEIAGVATPVMDKIITWAQTQLGKSYLVNGRLKGVDVANSRAPQKYGFHQLKDFV